MTKSSALFSLRILTINTHKGFTTFNRRFVLPQLRDAIRSVNPDIVCLQEVLGEHEIHALNIADWPQTSHYEFLADAVWQDYAYGQNAVYSEGYHGNAILSRYSIIRSENRDISIPGHEKRGLLHCEIALPAPSAHPLHIICAHLGLRERHRQIQLGMLSRFVNTLPDACPIVVAGDFNDWRQRANPLLRTGAGLEEIFTRDRGRPARTFPARFPLLRLDRIYIKNAAASAPRTLSLREWRHLSDHAPLAVEIAL